MKYSTTDLYFAAHLMAIGVPMSGTEKKNNRVHFIFDSSSANIEEIKHAYFAGSKELHYANCIKSLKTMCHMA